MKSHKSTTLITVLGLILSAVVAVSAQQSTTPSDQKKQAESCCAMDSCCGNGESCDMKHENHKKGHSADGSCCNMKQKTARNKTKQKTAKSESN